MVLPPSWTKVANVPLGSYAVDTDAHDSGIELLRRQAICIDIGEVVSTPDGDRYTPSRVSTSNPLPTSAALVPDSEVKALLYDYNGDPITTLNPVPTEIIGTPDINLVSILGQAPALNSGIATAGTIRVSQATDIPVLTNNRDGSGNSLESTLNAPGALSRALIQAVKYGYDPFGPTNIPGVGAANALTVSSGGYEMIEFTISGTHVGAAVAFQINYDNPGTNWTSLSCYYRYFDGQSSSVSGTNMRQTFRAYPQGLPFRLILNALTSGAVSIEAKLYRFWPWTPSSRVWGSVKVSGSIGTYPIDVFKAHTEPHTIDFTNVAAGAGAYVYVGTITEGNWFSVSSTNLLNCDLLVSLDGGSTSAFVMPRFDPTTGCGGDPFAKPYINNGFSVEVGNDIYVAYINAAPTQGNWYISGDFGT